MTRRRFLLMSLSGAVAVPLGAGAQQPGRVYRVAILHLTSATPPVGAFRSALRELGWVEGQTLAVDFRSAEGQAERLEVLAAELAASQPDVIVTGTSGAAVAAKRATATIPIVMAVSVDPVGLGVVLSLARPGANITGQAILSPELSTKRLELLNEALPRVRPCRHPLECGRRPPRSRASSRRQSGRRPHARHPAISRRGGWCRGARHRVS